MPLDIWTIIKIMEALGKVISFVMGGIAWLFLVFQGIGLTYLQSSILIGILFMIGFYVVFVLLKVVTKIMILLLTIGFITVFLGALVGVI